MAKKRDRPSQKLTGITSVSETNSGKSGVAMFTPVHPVATPLCQPIGRKSCKTTVYCAAKGSLRRGVWLVAKIAVNRRRHLVALHLQHVFLPRPSILDVREPV